MAARKVVLNLGMLPIPVRLEKATDDEDSTTKTVCTGTEDKPHVAAKVSSEYKCTHPECDRTASSWHPFEKGVPQPDGSYTVIDKTALAEANQPVKDMTLSFSSREKVFGSTVAGKSVNNVTPDKGGERGYTGLREALRSRPDLVAVTEWAHTTKNHLWVIELVDNRLVASQRSWPEEVRPVVDIPDAALTEQEQAFLTGFVESNVVDFDPLAYRDVARERRAELVAAAQGSDAPTPAPSRSPAPAGDMLAQLAASVSEQVSAAPTRKRAVKSVPAKKAAPRKRTAKKASAKRPPAGSAA